MIDIHSHLLPAVDDGSRDIQESIALLRIAVHDGIREMVLTPHIFAGCWDNNLTMLRPRFEAFARLIESKGIDIRLHLGAEVHLLVESLDLADRGEVPMMGTWNGSPALLIELHDARIPPFTVNAIRHLKKRGLQPIIAHPERNRAVMADPDCLEPLLAEGCLMQITAGSLIGGFGARAATAAVELLQREWVHFIATDAHNLRSRPPLMREARAFVARHYGEAVAERLTVENPAALIAAKQRPTGHPEAGVDRAAACS